VKVTPKHWSTAVWQYKIITVLIC